MRIRLTICCICSFLFTELYGQENPVPSVLRNINRQTLDETCIPGGKGRLIANRAMNLYLSDRVGYYLSSYGDLSLYKNSVVIDPYDQGIAVNHHIYTGNENDERVRSLFTVGAKATARHEFGFQFRYTWFGHGRMHYSGCEAGNSGDKQEMDAQRAIMLQQLGLASAEELAVFTKYLSHIKQEDVPGQDLVQVKEKLRKEFEPTLVEKYRKKFFEMQADTFRLKKPFQTFTFNWTDVHFYLPVASEIFYLETQPGGTQQEKHPWLWELAATHNRMMESKRMGRILLQLIGTIGQNNAAKSGMISKTGSSGRASVYSATSYEQFTTGSIGGRLVYMPPDWHFGLSCSIKQNIGEYHALDLMAGFPVVLIDKKGSPKINFEFQWRFFNVNGTALPLGKTSAINVTVGIPFGSIVY